MIKFWFNSPEYLIQKELRDYSDFSYRLTQSEGIPRLNEDDMLVIMGNKNLKKVQDAGFLPKNRTIGSMREVVHNIGPKIGQEEDNVYCITTYDADIKGFDYSSFVKMQTDLGLIYRWSQTGTLQPKTGSYHWVKDFDPLPHIINDMYNATGKRVRVSMDLETVGLNPFDESKWIVSISFSINEDESFLVYFSGVDDQPDKDSDLWDQINWMLNDDRISVFGANLKYDLTWIRVKWGMHCSNFKFDTTLVGSMLDENRSNSLNTHTKIYAPALGGYDDEFNRKYEKGRMDLVDKSDLLVYAGGDTDATLRVGNKMLTQLAKSKSQTNFYTKLLHPASRAFEDMEYTGIVTNTDKLQALQVEMFEVMAEQTDKAKALMPKKILAKYINDFRLTRSVIMKDFMFTHKKGLCLKPQLFTEKDKKPSTAMKHFKMFEDHPEAKEFMDIIKEFNSAKKTESTYITGFMNHLRQDGRLHPSAILHRGSFNDDSGDDSGTITGRLSFKDPAFQTVPKHTKWAKKLRQAYEAPEGYLVVNFDYSQGELRVIACVADEKNMIKAYRKGIDLHLKTGAELNGYTLENALELKKANDPLIKSIRQGGKAGNFGLIYDISPDGYVVYAQNTYGVSITLDEAEEAQNKFFSLYPAILDYHDIARGQARQNGYVQSPLGRVRHLPLINASNFSMRGQAERQAINSPIQSTLSDLSQLALAEFKKKHGYHADCRFFAMTHDSLTAYVKEDSLDFWIPEVQGIMENLPIKEYFGWEPQLTFVTDAEIGYNMGDMIELADHPGKTPSSLVSLLAA